MIHRRHLLGALLALAGTPALTQATSAQTGAGFTSGGKAVTVERFSAPGTAARPGIVLLHGSDGPGPRYWRAAQFLASAGYHVFLVHYLDRTDQSRASLASIPGNLPVWTATAREAVSYVAAQPGVAAGRIGLFGISLGGGIALGVAAQDRRVGALVSYFGFVPSGFDTSAALPPTLVLHGEDDRVVPVSNARTLQRILEARGTPHEVQIYPGEGHGFSAAATADAAARITRFFGRTLGGRRS